MQTQYAIVPFQAQAEAGKKRKSAAEWRAEVVVPSNRDNNKCGVHRFSDAQHQVERANLGQDTDRVRALSSASRSHQPFC